MISFGTLGLIGVLLIGIVVAAGGLAGGLAGSMSSDPAAGASAEKGGCMAVLVGIGTIAVAILKLTGVIS